MFELLCAHAYYRAAAFKDSCSGATNNSAGAVVATRGSLIPKQEAAVPHSDCATTTGPVVH